MRLADVERRLRRHGCVLEREGAAHSIWSNPAPRKIASVPRHREIKEGTVRAICRQLEIRSRDISGVTGISTRPLSGWAPRCLWRAAKISAYTETGCSRPAR
jgi:mRNA interferase HicA